MPAEIQATIGQAKALISMRLHPLIFATNEGTPLVAIAYAKKVRAFCEQAGVAPNPFARRPAMAGQGDQASGREVLDLEKAKDARSRQHRALGHAYSQFFRWLRREPTTALHHGQKAVQFS